MPQTKSDSSPIAVGLIACPFPYRSSPATWILPCTHVKKRRLNSASYGSPVRCLVQTRSTILVQTGSILSQTCLAWSLLRSRRMKTSVAIWLVTTCSVFAAATYWCTFSPLLTTDPFPLAPAVANLPWFDCQEHCPRQPLLSVWKHHKVCLLWAWDRVELN